MAQKKNTTNPSDTKNSKSKEQKKTREFRFDFNIKNLFIIGFAAIFIFYILSAFLSSTVKEGAEKPITTIIKDIRDGKVKQIDVADNKVVATYKDNTKAVTYKEMTVSFDEMLKNANVTPSNVVIKVENTQASLGMISFLSNLIPTLLMVAFFIFIFRQAKGAQDSVFSFGQSKAKRFNKDLPKTKFKDVAGVDEAKNELEEVVDFLRNSEKYKKVGARTPKGVLLIGPAGCGKTLLAKAVAGEANVPFFSIAGSEFMEMLVGIGAARVRDLFATAKKNAPAIIFIDEIDAIGRARSSGVMPAHDEREQTLNQILVEMDGFTPNEQVIIMAATNRGDLLDTALLRPGRFDRRVIVDYPDVAGRKAILEIHARNKPFDENVNWDRIANRTVGFSGADLENMLNEAAIYAVRQNRSKLTMDDLEEAATKVKMGPEKKRLQTDYDKKLTAYHEAGHALVSHFQPHTDPVHRISIVSRGMALGYTLIPPARDKVHQTKTHLLERISVMMGGRAAEEMVFNEITTGASNDFNQATSVARAMVMEFGMSSLGPVKYGATNDAMDWGRSGWEDNSISQTMLAKIDDEIKKILLDGYNESLLILKNHKDMLDKVAKELIKKENMDQDEFEAIVGKKAEALD